MRFPLLAFVLGLGLAASATSAQFVAPTQGAGHETEEPQFVQPLSLPTPNSSNNNNNAAIASPSSGAGLSTYVPSGSGPAAAGALGMLVAYLL